MHIPTPMKNDKASKRTLIEATDMEVDGQSISKITKISSHGKDIIEVKEKFINHNDQNKTIYI